MRGPCHRRPWQDRRGSPERAGLCYPGWERSASQAWSQCAPSAPFAGQQAPDHPVPPTLRLLVISVARLWFRRHASHGERGECSAGRGSRDARGPRASRQLHCCVHGSPGGAVQRFQGRPSPEWPGALQDLSLALRLWDGATLSSSSCELETCPCSSVPAALVDSPREAPRPVTGAGPQGSPRGPLAVPARVPACVGQQGFDTSPVACAFRWLTGATVRGSGVGCPLLPSTSSRISTALWGHCQGSTEWAPLPPFVEVVQHWGSLALGDSRLLALARQRGSLQWVCTAALSWMRLICPGNAPLSVGPPGNVWGPAHTLSSG